MKDGCSFRSIAGLLQIATGTVLSRILRVSKAIRKLFLSFGKTYEVEELYTYVQQKAKQYWFAYAILKDTKEVVDFTVGNRSNTVLRSVTDTLLLSNATKIYTDKLKQYTTILPKSIHKTSLHGTNYIERMNLTLRIHLKRLNRKTICFSKSIAMLVAWLKIYF